VVSMRVESASVIISVFLVMERQYQYTITGPHGFFTSNVIHALMCI